MSFVDPLGQWFMHGDPDRKCPSIVSMGSELMFPVSWLLFPEKTQKNFRWLKILRILLKSSVCIARVVNSQPMMVAGGDIHMGNVGLKNLYPDTTRYPLKKSKRTDNIIDFVHAIM